MNREIKFRYWNTITKQMVNEPVMPYKKGWTITQLFSDRGWIWMQYTGLKDKKGKEIYEGDIIRTWDEKDNLEEIVFEGGSFVSRHFGWEDGTGGSLWANRKVIENDTEIIGNIYENPELLTNKEL